MKKQILYLFFASFFFANNGMAQLSDGSVAPNWTLTDIDGNTHTLYDYLDAGKTVYIDFFATWCGPCWSYHNSGAMEDLYYEYGPDGTDEVMVFAIEGDANTPLSALYGTGNTQGDWVTGTPYPIIEGESIIGDYQIAYWPTIYAICPNRIITELGAVSTSALYAHVDECPPMGAFITDVGVENVSCLGGDDGRITLYTEGWPGPLTYQWSNGETTKQIEGLTAGTYSCTVSTSSGSSTTTTGPIEVIEPAMVLELEWVETSQPTCNTPLGTISVMATGGEGPYLYDWSYGSSQESSSSPLPSGFYSVTVTDNLGCSTFLTGLEVSEPVLPIASAGPNQMISCENNLAFLDGSESSTGIDILYDWYTFDGVIGVGQNEMVVEVTAPGTYYLSVLNTTTGCLVEDEVQVIGDISSPEVSISTPSLINCVNVSVTLNVTVPSGSNYDVSWTTEDGHFLSGENTASPIVDAAGSYTVSVLNTENGCSTEEAVMVMSNTEVPIAQATVSGVLDCLTPSVTLDASGSSSGENYTYAWTQGSTVLGRNITYTATNSGEYMLIVTNIESACTQNTLITVAEDIDLPIVDAGSDVILTCTVNDAVLNGAVEGGANFEWSTTDGHFVSGEDSLNPTIDASGTYLLTATNPENGCINESEVVVTQDIEAPIAMIANPDQLTCEITNVTLDATGSSTGSGFSYEWSTENGHISSGVNQLLATVDAGGVYHLTINNQDNGCQTSASVTVEFESTLTGAIAQEAEVLCNGEATATLVASFEGGSAPYSVAWNTGETGDTLSGVGAGNYISTVTDAEGCSFVLNYEVAEPTAMAVTADVASQSAFGVNDGSINLSVDGGTPGYSYEWSNGSTTEDVSALAPGDVTVQVTDANGCSFSQTFTIGAYDCQVSVAGTSVDVSCNGGADGSLEVVASSGVEPYTYTWTNGATTATIDQLAVGDYGLTVLDGASCPFYATYTVAEPSEIVVQITIAQPSCAADCAIVDMVITGGVPPYWYNYPDNIDCLTAGTYEVEIVDANGCSKIESFTVLAPEDTEPPVVQTISAITVSLNADGMSTPLTTDFVDSGSTDNCGIDSMALDRTVFGCDEVGVQDVTFSVTDLSGNVSSVILPVTVSDAFFLPSVDCPENVEVTSCDHIVTYELPEVHDNCPLTDGSLTLTEGLSSGEVFEVGETVVAYMVVDAGGNEATCSFNVQVIDANTMEVALDAITNEIDSNGSGAIEVSLTGGAEPFMYEWSQDGVIISNEEDLSGLSAGEYTLVVTDAARCQTDEMTFVVDNLVGINERQLNVSLDLMPNPASGIIYGKLAQGLDMDASISFINILGQPIISGVELSRGTTQFQLDLSALISGTYFLNIKTEKGDLFRKVIVE